MTDTNFEELKKQLRGGFNGDCERDSVTLVRCDRGDCACMSESMNSAADAIEQLQQENSELRKRLEMDPRHNYDGIDCRDTTIRELERDLEEARKRIAELEKAILDADVWVRAGEGVSLEYYHDYDDDDSVAVIQSLRTARQQQG